MTQYNNNRISILRKCMTSKKENETSLIYPIHTFLRAILGDKCEKIVRKGGERGNERREKKKKKEVHVNTEKS